MKTKMRISIWLMLLLLFAGAIGAQAQIGTLDKLGDEYVCLNSTEPYGVELTPGSSYVWSITPAAAGKITSGNSEGTTENLISVTWNQVGTHVLQVIETNAAGCEGPPVFINVIVHDLPIVNPMLASVCSETPIGVNLPTTSTNGLTLDKWDITGAVVATGLTGTATTGLGLTDPTAIAGDVFTNTTGAPLTVVYTVIPYAGTCVGDPFTITVTITSGPTVADIDNKACSEVAIGTVLPATSLNGLGLTSYDIAADMAIGLTGTPTTGTGITDINVIAGDTFTNPTSGTLDVVYTITPYVGTCKGDPFTIIVHVAPEITTSPIYHD